MELRAPLVIRWAPRGTQWKVEGVDRAALKDPACCNKFKLALRAIRSPPWCMSVDEHERFAAGAVCKAAKAAFGAPSKHPRREHIDDMHHGGDRMALKASLNLLQQAGSLRAARSTPSTFHWVPRGAHLITKGVHCGARRLGPWRPGV